MNNKTINTLIEKYSGLDPLERLTEIFNDFDEKNVLVTTSFGTSSVYLLSLIKRVKPNHKIYFIDTTFHFEETHEYKKQLEELLGLNIITLLPNGEANEYTRENETWKTDTDLCCEINKVKPIEKIKAKHQVWISGLMKFQNDFRKIRPVFEQNGILKFYPIIDVAKSEVENFIRTHKLPQHPLLSRGFDSIGCTHCTAKGIGRSGRWSLSNKSECGLHEFKMNEKLVA